MNKLTLENIDLLLEEMERNGGEPNLIILRCPSCNVIYSYAYVGINPNIEVEHHKKECYFNKEVNLK